MNVPLPGMVRHLRTHLDQTADQPFDRAPDFLATCFVKLLEAVEAVQGIPYNLARLAYISKLFGKIQKARLVFYDFLFFGHPTLHCFFALVWCNSASATPPLRCIKHPHSLLPEVSD